MTYPIEVLTRTRKGLERLLAGTNDAETVDWLRADIAALDHAIALLRQSAAVVAEDRQ